jgi:predicted amidohydrolase
VKLALSQVIPYDGDVTAAFAHVKVALATAACAGADVLVLPELFLPGYNRPDLHARMAQTQAGDWIARLRDLAAEAVCGLAVGWAERVGEDVFNAATVIGPTGQILAHYHKIQLFGPMERDSFCFGKAPPPIFDLAGLRCGLLICYDIEFPAHAADLARRGAEVILVPTANPEGFDHVQRVLVPARAHENRMFVAYANYCGTEQGLIFGGQSVVVGPDAAVLAAAGCAPALLITELPPFHSYPPGTLATLSDEYRATSDRDPV